MKGNMGEIYERNKREKYERKYERNTREKIGQAGHRLWIGERPQPVVIFLTSCVPKPKIDWPSVNLKKTIFFPEFSFTFVSRL